MYRNAQEGTAQAAGINTAGAVNQKTLIGTKKNLNDVAMHEPDN